MSFCREIPITMPRNYKKKLGRDGKLNYEKRYIINAVEAVRSGMPIRQASETYAVPYTTLQNRVRKTYLTDQIGRPTALSEGQENRLIEGLLQCAKWGFPLKTIDIRNLVQSYLNFRGRVEKRFRDNRPGADWVRGLLKRHPQLTVRLSENIKRSRASVSHDIINKYFDNLRIAVDGVSPSNIVNYDETNFTDDPGQVKVVVKRGSKHVERIIDTSKTSISVMIAAAADGTLLPPYTVYKAKHIYPSWTEGGVNGAGYNRNSSGWFDSTMFEDWFSNILLPYFKKQNGRKIMIGDNLSSHLSLNVIRECRRHDIHFILLPANSTHLCQPLDVAFFRPLKIAWRSVLDTWKKSNRGVLPKSEFPRLLKDTFKKVGVQSASNIIAGFKKTGIVPLNPNKVLTLIPNTAENRDDDEENPIAWTSAFVTHLEQNRVASPANKARISRSKKFDVEPGKSVVVREDEDSDNEEENERNEDQENDEQVNENQNGNEEFEDQGEDSGDENQETEENENHEAENKEKEVEAHETNQRLQINQYVLVSFPTNKRERKFLGRVVDLPNDQGGKLKVNFLRKNLNSKQHYFYFPNVEDIDEIEASQVVRILKCQDIGRGRFVFHSIDDIISSIE